MASLTPVICVEHQTTFIWPLDSSRIPLFIPRMYRPVVKHFTRTVRTKPKAVVEMEVSFDRHHVPVGCRISSVQPTQFKPVPVAYEELTGQPKTGRRINRYPVFVMDRARLDRSEKFVATTEDKIVFLVGIDVFKVRLQDRLELIAESCSCIPLLEGVANSLLETGKCKDPPVRRQLHMNIGFGPNLSFRIDRRLPHGTGAK